MVALKILTSTPVSLIPKVAAPVTFKVPWRYMFLPKLRSPEPEIDVAPAIDPAAVTPAD